MNYIIELLVSFAFEAVGTALSMITNILTQSIDLSGSSTLDKFFSLFSYCGPAYTVFVYAGFFILLTICVFQLFKSLFTPITDNTEDPIKLIIRTVCYMGLVAFSYQICSIIIEIGSVPYQILAKLSPDSMATLSNALSSDMISEKGMAVLGAIAVPIFATGGFAFGLVLLVLLLYTIVFFMLLSNYFKLALEIIERYCILGLLTIVSPLCIATGASKATESVFKSFIKMYISQIVVMCFSIFFLQSFNFAFGQWITTSLDPMSLLMLLAWLKLGQRVDAHMSALGLNTAQAGGMSGDIITGLAGSGLLPGMRGGAGGAMGAKGAASVASPGIALQNGIANKMFGTNFGKPGGTANLAEGVRQALTGKADSKRAQSLCKEGSNGAGIMPGTGKITDADKKAERQSGQKLGQKEFDTMKGTGNTYEGRPVGENLKMDLGGMIPENYTPTENCSIKGNEFYGEFEDEDGNIVAMSGHYGTPNEDEDALGQVQNKNDDDSMTINGVDGDGAYEMVTGETQDPLESADYNEVETPESMETVDNEPISAEDINENSRVSADGELLNEGDEGYEDAIPLDEARMDEDGQFVGPEDEGYEDAQELAKFDEDGNVLNPGDEGYEDGSYVNEDGEMAPVEQAGEIGDDSRIDEDGNVLNPGDEGYENAIPMDEARVDEDGNILGAQDEGYEDAQPLNKFDEDGNVVKPGEEGYENGSYLDENGNAADVEFGKDVNDDSRIDENGNILNPGEEGYENATPLDEAKVDNDGNVLGKNDAGYEDAQPLNKFDEDGNVVKPGEEGYENGSYFNQNGKMADVPNEKPSNNDSRIDNDGNILNKGDKGFENATPLSEAKVDKDGNVLGKGDAGYNSAQPLNKFDENGNVVKPGEKGFEGGSYFNQNGKMADVQSASQPSNESRIDGAGNVLNKGDKGFENATPLSEARVDSNGNVLGKGDAGYSNAQSLNKFDENGNVVKPGEKGFEGGSYFNQNGKMADVQSASQPSNESRIDGAGNVLNKGDKGFENATPLNEAKVDKAGNILGKGDAGYDNAQSLNKFDENGNVVKPGEKGFEGGSYFNQNGKMADVQSGKPLSNESRIDSQGNILNKGDKGYDNASSLASARVDSNGNVLGKGDAGYSNAQSLNKFDSNGNVVKPGEEGFKAASYVNKDGKLAPIESKNGSGETIQPNAGNVTPNANANTNNVTPNTNANVGNITPNANANNITPNLQQGDSKSVRAAIIAPVTTAQPQMSKAAAFAGDSAQRDTSQVRGEKPKLETSSSGAFAATRDGSALKQDNYGNVGLLKGGTGSKGYMQDASGNNVYDKNSGQFMPKSEAMNNDGSVKQGLNLAGGNNAPTSFANVNNTKAGETMANKQSEGNGVHLQKTSSGEIARFDADGRETKNGSFVKTDGANQLMSATAFVSKDGKVTGFSAQGTSAQIGKADGTGYTELNRDASGKALTYNANGEVNKAGKGDLVQDKSGNMYSRNSFAQDANGNVQQFQAAKGSGLDKLEKGTNGKFQEYNASGEMKAGGGYYKRTDGNGDSSLVSKNSYATDDKGRTASFRTSGEGYGDRVKGEDGKMYRLASPGKPARYDANGNESANGNFASVLTPNGQNVLKPVEQRSDGAGPQTYKMAAQRVELQNVDGSRIKPEITSFSAVQGQQGNYIKTANGKTLEVDSAKGKDSNGNLRTYDKTSDGKYVENNSGRGSYVPISTDDKFKTSYAPLESTRDSNGRAKTYTPNYASPSGVPISKDGNVQLESGFKMRHTGEQGVYTANIAGQQRNLYDAKIYDANSMQGKDANMVKINGKQFVMTSAGNSTIEHPVGKTFTGDAARSVMNQYGLGDKQKVTTPDGGIKTVNNHNTCVQTKDGMLSYNSNQTRTAEKGPKGTTVYTQPGYLNTDIKPKGDAGKDYILSKNPVTGKQSYKVPVKVTYSSKKGGVPTFRTASGKLDNGKKANGPKRRASVGNTTYRTKKKNPTQQMRQNNSRKPK